jgi:transcriptional regulator of acetoin/glycerol metabolism
MEYYEDRKETGRKMVEIWENLHMKGSHDEIILSPVIKESWQRCKSMNIDRFMRRNYYIIGEHELKKRKAANHSLLEEATIGMQSLYDFTKGSGFAFALTDSEGFILERIGDKSELDFTSRSNFIEGSNWSERIIGTNAVGTALATRQPIQVFAYEHYCRCNASATCSAAPIYDNHGNIIGVLDITGPSHLVNQHTLGMAVSSARAIERQLFLSEAYNQVKMLNIYSTKVMNSVSEGLITLDNDERISIVNLSAAKQIGIDQKSSIGQKLRSLLPQGNEYFFKIIFSDKNADHEPLTIKTINNNNLKVTITTYQLKDENGRTTGTIIMIHPMAQYRGMIKRVAGMRASVTFNNIIGQSNDFKKTIEVAQISATSASNILLIGESGTGKDLLAQAIHNASGRRDEPFFAINCAALPRELISSELFGYEEGAFTGARRGGNPGKFELADQGTIFLDEISEIPLDLQGSLLRVLEENKVMRLGSDRVVPIDVRIIAATNRNLMDEVKKGNFRLDLYYRLSVILINIPPLKNRREDIALLFDYFVKLIGPKLGKTIKHVDPNAMEMLLNYDWPGNARELQNFVERTINIINGEKLTVDMLPPEMISYRNSTTDVIHIRDTNPSKIELEVDLIKKYLATYNNNKSTVAKKLGVSRGYLYRKIKRFKIM